MRLAAARRILPAVVPTTAAAVSTQQVLLLTTVMMTESRRFHSSSPRTPPPIRKLPPAPPLPGRSVTDSSSVFGAQVFKAPHEILTMLVEFIPTFYVPLHAAASIMSDECRDMIKVRSKASAFFRRYRMFFDLQLVEGNRYEVRLREDVVHPRRGAADEKFSLADIGENATFQVVPEYVTNLDSIDSRNDMNVNVTPVLPPPSLHVRLQERVPVLERLKAMIPEDSFVPIDEVNERIPEDILSHPYFDVQGGLAAIATKFPDSFQVVDGQIRQRPPELAPLALDEYSFSDSPEPEIVAIVKRGVCVSDIPTWVSVTSLYEQLSTEQRRKVKRMFKSFAGFLRTHGRSLALSNDLLRVSHWIAPASSKKNKKQQKALSSSSSSLLPAAATADIVVDVEQQQQKDNKQDADNANGKFSENYVLNELYDRFPRGKELAFSEFVQHHVPDHLKPSLPPPNSLAAFLDAHPQYFIIEKSGGEGSGESLRIRRAGDPSPLDLALQLYPLIPADDGIAVVALMQKLPPGLKAHVEQVGIYNVVDNLSEWLELLDGDLFQRKSMAELEAALQK